MRFALPGRVRKSLVALSIVVSLCMSFFAFTGVASARSAAPAPAPTPLCAIHFGSSSFVEAGLGPAQESSIALVIIVECRPIYSQNTVTINAKQLFNICHGTLTWDEPPSPPVSTAAPQFTVTLDNDGNAEATVWGGPSCAPAPSLICASLNAPPFTTVCKTFKILPPQDTPPGVKAMPATEVEDGVFSSVETVIFVEFPSVQAEKFVDIKADQLFTRCAGNLSWFGPEEVFLTSGPEVDHVQLDNNGNAFVVALAGPSCASGKSTVFADLETVPFTTRTTTFTVLSPRPTCTPAKC